jgi:hypothetical protein
MDIIIGGVDDVVAIYNILWMILLWGDLKIMRCINVKVSK